MYLSGSHGLGGRPGSGEGARQESSTSPLPCRANSGLRAVKLFPFVPMSILRSELVHARRALYVMNDRSGDSIQIVRWLLLHASTCHCPETLPNVPRVRSDSRCRRCSDSTRIRSQSVAGWSANLAGDTRKIQQQTRLLEDCGQARVLVQFTISSRGRTF